MLTLVATMYNVEIYLEDFFESLDRQLGVRHRHIPIILVDDGSSDRTLKIARRWKARTRYQVSILTQENSGPGAARNQGIENCQTSWLTFLDADDVISDNYLSEILDRIEIGVSHPSIIVTNIIRFLEAKNEVKNDHPLKYKFRDGSRTVHLNKAPHFFQLSSSTATFQTHVIQKHALRFDTSLLVFEDAKFIGEYLLYFNDPTVAVLHKAQYLYRRRKDDSSLVPSAERSAMRFVDVPERAYLHLINSAAKMHGHVPEWLQAMVIYDLYWTIRLDEGMDAPARAQSRETRSRFVALLREIVKSLSDEQITYARAVLLPEPIRDFLLALKNELRTSPTVVVDRIDPSQQIMRLRYHYPIGHEPQETLNWNGVEIEPTYSKRRSVTFFDEIAYMERILWVPADMELAMYLDRKRVTFSRGENPQPRPVMHEWLSWNYFVPKRPRPSVREGNLEVQANILSDRNGALRYPDGQLSRASLRRVGA